LADVPGHHRSDAAMRDAVLTAEGRRELSKLMWVQPLCLSRMWAALMDNERELIGVAADKGS
jgi:hypothetical protein